MTITRLKEFLTEELPTPAANEAFINRAYNLKVNIKYTDLTDTAGLTKTVAIWPSSGNAGAGTAIIRAATKVITAFVGCATLGVEIGDDGDVDRNMVSSDMKATAATWKVAVPSTTPSVLSAANTIDALFTATTNNLSALTAGEVDIYLEIIDLERTA